MGLFYILFFFVFGMIIYTLVQNVAQWHRNNQSPQLSIDAKIIGKRFHVSHHRYNHNGHHHNTKSTTYYVTFEVRGGDCLELKIPRDEYGLLVEGDIGVLSFQGTRYLGFERKTSF